MSIENKMEYVRQLAEDGKKEESIIAINQLINDDSTNPDLFILKGSLHARDKNYDEAIENVNKAICLCPKAATFYFHRGRYNFASNNLLQAIIDFSKALDEDDYNDITFTQILYFYRAEAFIKRGLKKEALSDMSHIPNEYQIWTFKLRSKEDLIKDCKKI